MKSRKAKSGSAHLKPLQLLAGVSCQVIRVGQTGVQLSQPEGKLRPLFLKALPLPHKVLREQIQTFQEVQTGLT